MSSAAISCWQTETKLPETVTNQEATRKVVQEQMKQIIGSDMASSLMYKKWTLFHQLLYSAHLEVFLLKEEAFRPGTEEVQSDKSSLETVR